MVILIWINYVIVKTMFVPSLLKIIKIYREVLCVYFFGRLASSQISRKELTIWILLSLLKQFCLAVLTHNSTRFVSMAEKLLAYFYVENDVAIIAIINNK